MIYAYSILLSATTLTLIAGVGIFLLMSLLLVAILLTAKRYLVKTGMVDINLNDSKNVEAMSGKSLLSTMADANIFLPSACGGKGSCGQCKVEIKEGGGEILPTEAVHFSRKEIQEGWRLACEV